MAIEGIDDYRRRFEDEAKRQIGLIMRTQKQQVGLALLEQVDNLTPRDTGEALRGWHFSSPRPTGRDVQDQDQVDALAKLTNEAAPGDDLYLQNHVAHINVLDEGLFEPPNPGPSKDPREGRFGEVLVSGGFSVQAPRGIKGDALDEVAAQFGLQRITEGS